MKAIKFLIISSHLKQGKRLRFPNELLQFLRVNAKEITIARDWFSALGYLAVESFTAIWTEWESIEENFEQFQNRIKKQEPRVPIIVITGGKMISRQLCQHNDLIFAILNKATAVETSREIIDRLTVFYQLSHQIPGKTKHYLRPNGFGPFIGNSLSMLEIYRQIARVAPTDFTVLIQGASGSGKELVARAIHQLSTREDQPYISLNCAAIPESLLESELFGYEKGAFTGANQTKPGKFELADKGTLFMDEIGDMALPLQAKLLRVLEDQKVERLGGTKIQQVDVRLLAATNQDLFALVKANKFRSDLHYRMNVIPIKLEPLNDRQDDILLLVMHILKNLLKKHTAAIDSISWDLIESLKKLPIAGNVRELENLLTRIVFHNDNRVLDFTHEQFDLLMDSEIEEKQAEDKKVCPLWQIEKQTIERAMKSMNGNISQVANTLEISRVTLYRKMKKYGINFQ